jgi:hypothetical protein
MGTDNPKVSAYVPQALKNRLKEFREERGNIPESQAVIIILAEYFQMPEALGQSPGTLVTGGVTLARMEAIEETLASFVKSTENRLTILQDTIQKLSELSVVREVEKTFDSDFFAVELPNEFLDQDDGNQNIEPIISNKENEDILLSEEEETVDTGNLESTPELAKENTQQVNGNHQQSDNVQEKLFEELESDVEELSRPILSLLSEPPTNDILESVPLKLLEIRLGVSSNSISVLRGRYSPEKFKKWTANKDPSRISWKQRGKGKGYTPDDELTSEQKSELLEWLQMNS